jgi:alkaline phosphatase D
MDEMTRAVDRLLATSTSRRRFLTRSGGAAALALATRLPGGNAWAVEGPFGGYPFTLGVASGDPLPDSVVLWTRMAPEPLSPDGSGGMPPRRTPVRWQVATDERMRNVVRRGVTHAEPEYAHSVHVDVRGLEAGTEYHYQFKAGPELSEVGRTKTAPARGAAVPALAFAFASCQNYPAGHYTAYRHMANEDLDLVVHLGDYIYEGSAQGAIGRGHVPNAEIYSLADYRVRLAQYKTDPDLQAAHAAFPWLVTWDDHEVENNYADEISQANDPVAAFLARRANAYRAYWEHMPLRPLQMPNGPDMPLYRRFTFGDLAEFSVLDTRQYRSDQACGDGRDVNCEERLEPARTITGDEQERWLLDGLEASRSTWNVLAQQVFFAQRDFDPGPEQSLSMDAWDGYKASRDRVLSGIVERGVRNPMVLTGDVHQHYAADLKVNFDEPESATIGSELVGTSISSGGDGTDQGIPEQLAENPHIKYHNRQRGYVRCQLTPSTWTADFKVVEYVTVPGAPIRTDATFLVEPGSPGLQRG